METNNTMLNEKKLNRYIGDLPRDKMEERSQFSLSLRKKKINAYLFSKRKNKDSNSNDNNIINYSYKIFSIFDNDSLITNENYKLFSSNNDVNISKYLASKNKKEIKTGILLLNLFINNDKHSIELLETKNCELIPCFFQIIKANIYDKELIFNILHYLTNLTYKINNNNIIQVLNEEFFSVLNLCFLLNDYDIIYQIICLLNNIFKDILISSDMIMNELFEKSILDFFSREEIIFDIKYNNNRADISFNIIEGGLVLLCSILSKFCDIISSNEEIKLLEKFLEIIIILSNTNDIDKYTKCLYSIAFVLERELSLSKNLVENNFIKNTLINNKFFDDEKVMTYINKIILSCFTSEIDIDNHVLKYVLDFEIYYLNKFSNNCDKNEVFSTLSCLINFGDEITDEIFNNNEFLSNIISSFNSSSNINDLKEIFYFFTLLVNKCRVNQFLIIRKYNLMSIILDHGKKELFTQNNDEYIILLLQLIEQLLIYGKELSNVNNGVNEEAQKFIEFGGNELFKSYEISQNNEISEKALKLNDEYIKQYIN